MIKKHFRIICFIMTLAMAALVFCGCGETKVLSLEEMVAQNPDMAKSIEEGLTDLEAAHVTQSVSYKGNTIVLSLKYEKAYKDEDAAALAEAFAANEEAYEPACNQAIADIKKNTELEKVKVKVQVLNGDDSEIWTKTYKGK